MPDTKFYGKKTPEWLDAYEIWRDYNHVLQDNFYTCNEMQLRWFMRQLHNVKIMNYCLQKRYKRKHMSLCLHRDYIDDFRVLKDEIGCVGWRVDMLDYFMPPTTLHQYINASPTTIYNMLHAYMPFMSGKIKGANHILGVDGVLLRRGAIPEFCALTGLRQR